MHTFRYSKLQGITTVETKSIICPYSEAAIVLESYNWYRPQWLVPTRLENDGGAGLKWSERSTDTVEHGMGENTSQAIAGEWVYPHS